MTPLALDLGSHVIGWCVPPRSGVLRMAALPRGKEHRDMRLARTLDRVARWLPDVIIEHRPDYMVVENPFHPMLREIMGLVRLIAYRHELLLDIVAPVQWQAWVKREKIPYVKSDEEDARMIAAWSVAQRKIEEV